MKLGVVFPTNEIGNDPSVIKNYAQQIENLGYDHLIAYDHVLGVDPATRPGQMTPYSEKHPFHEPLVLFGFLAACTEKIELATGILILPQRQTVLVAKQAAEVDVLSGGRLRLGVGLGWLDVEYVALGKDYKTRGHDIEEQVEVLRALWADDLITFEGEKHTIPQSGINPLPVQRPIPIWFGAVAEAAVRRAARIGDGWFPIGGAEDMTPVLAMFREEAEKAGRDPDTLGISPTLRLGSPLPDAPPADLDELVDQAGAWKELGATHLAINTMRVDLAGADEHLAVAAEFKSRVEKEVGLAA